MDATFSRLTEVKLRSYGIPDGPSSDLRTSSRSARKKEAFVLLLQDPERFERETYPLEDDDEELLPCVREIKRRLGTWGVFLLTAMKQRILEIIDEEISRRVDYALEELL
ncbi:7514_t:CDS:2 [Funneliformis caledonium]|uniref:7514_t:CDS:1 n=1 Tax=Funneliformis caledonium TaxID=1117310 RepID=A0A9N9BNS5_9GLOM|nr:7514_t:CDS:2 [Funneliformis caledonium]